jgi:hypothetical protein
MRTIIEGTVKELLEIPKLEYPRPIVSLDFLRRVADDTLTIIEVEPQFRTLRFSVAYDSSNNLKGKARFCVPLPYLQFFYLKGYLGVAASGKPYKLGDDFYDSPFPNTYATGKVCMGEVPTLERAISIFYWSGFDSPCEWDTSKNVAAAFSQGCHTYPEADSFLQKWSELSIDDMLNCPWIDNVLGRDYCFENPAKDNLIGNVTPFLFHVVTREHP